MEFFKLILLAFMYRVEFTFSYPNMDSFERKRSEGWLPFCGIGHKLVSPLVQLNCVQIFPLQMI